MSLLIFTGCADEMSSTSSPDGDISVSSLPVDVDEYACQRDDGADSLSIAAGWQLVSASHTAVEKTPFRCLRLLRAADVSSTDSALHRVNIAREGSDLAGQLRIPLHEIKTKAFLRDRSIAIFSNGRQFAALEKECTDIRASGIDDVVAVLPTAAKLTADRDEQLMNAPMMTPPEFIAERAYGVWHFVNLTDQEVLESPLFANTNKPGLVVARKSGRGSTAGLVRTLVVFNNVGPTEAQKVPQVPPFAGQVFVLLGGLDGLQRYEAEATAMARALARPRLNERGCS